MAASARTLGLTILSLLLGSSITSASLVSTGLSVALDDVYYFVSPFSAGKIDVPHKKESLCKVPDVVGFKPVTIVQGAVSASVVPQLLSNWTVIDDVYQAAFSEAIFLVGPKTGKRDQTEGVTEAHIFDRAPSTIIPLASSASEIPSGPYFLETATGSLYPVYRLYDDFAGAFLEPLIPTPDGKFQPISAKIAGSATLSVGVPSRLYFTKTKEKPLAGVRVGVKDIYRLAGVKGSNGNRAWYNLYPASNATGTAVQRLIDAGAQIVGLQKTSQFANGETATADWVDYHSPFNPRGDGYQDPSSSSAGAGASVASYEWLDIAIGSDTGGSIRGPAGSDGLFGNRPTHGLVALDNVMPLAPSLDTAGFLVRDPHLWDTASAVLYGANYSSLAEAKPTYPTKIYTLGFPTAPSSPAETMLVDFANALAKFVKGSVAPLNLQAEWAASKPSGAGNATLSQLLNITYPAIISREQTPLVRDPFYRDYAAAHAGRRPFIDPVPLSRWAFGDALSAATLAQQYTAKSLFQSWFTSHILPPATATTTTSPSSKSDTCSSALILYIGADGSQNPRNAYLGLPNAPWGFSSSRISPFTGVPDHVWPVGEAASYSAITGANESLPVVVDVLAAASCDGMLVRLAQELVEAGLVRVPKVGREVVEGGEVLMRRGVGGMGWGQ